MATEYKIGLDPEIRKLMEEHGFKDVLGDDMADGKTKNTNK